MPSKPEIRKIQQKKYREENKILIAEKKKAYRLANRAKLSAYQREYKRNRVKNDPQFRLEVNLRNRITSAVKGNYKSGSAVADLGCSIEEFKLYIESKFLDGMTWDNYGEWHLDHIHPIALFNLSNREEFLKACHFSNYQPLWAIDNLKKGNKMVSHSGVEPLSLG